MEKQYKGYFFDSGKNTGLYNMEIDKSMLNTGFSDIEFLFRLYEWNEPTISIGRFQNPENFLNVENCKRDNIKIVRRITGGGAILHSSELTYSTAVNINLFDGLSVKESYEKITSFLLKFYMDLGFTADYKKYTDSNTEDCCRTEICYSGYEEFDIVIKDKKTGGNAQKRTREKIFQHGTIPLKYEKDLYERYFKKSFLPKFETTGSLDELGVIEPLKKIKERLKKAYIEEFDVLLMDCAIGAIKIEDKIEERESITCRL